MPPDGRSRSNTRSHTNFFFFFFSVFNLYIINSILPPSACIVVYNVYKLFGKRSRAGYLKMRYLIPLLFLSKCYFCFVFSRLGGWRERPYLVRRRNQPVPLGNASRVFLLLLFRDSLYLDAFQSVWWWRERERERRFWGPFLE